MIVLYDIPARAHLFPLTYTRAIASLRIGILTIKEHWELLTQEKVYVHTDNYLSGLYPTAPKQKLRWINAACLPDEALWQEILQLDEKTSLRDDKGLIAFCCVPEEKFQLDKAIKTERTVRLFQNTRRLERPWQLFEWNDLLLRTQFRLLTHNRTSAPLSPTNNILHPENVFAEEGVQMEYCTINAATGPVYLGRNVQVMEGSLIRGSLALCEQAVVKMGTKLYGATTVGPCCTVGGELKNVVLQANSNKAHDGYLGDSVIGEWCNFGAGTSGSNVKNTATPVTLYNAATKQYDVAGTKCGVIMGDYTRVAINTAINTGTYMGVCSNVFSVGLTPKKVGSFSWQGQTLDRYAFEKALKDISNWKRFKHQDLKDAEAFVLKHIFDNYAGE
jgi:UDP-N-acetylglucosamine diphosphorylase/glucosamine-1-phosphate N-acetyltransferase